MFENGWKQFGFRYELLKRFCADLASGFPGTSTVESYFSRLDQQETKERSNLGKLALAGAMHGKQWDEIRRVFVV